MGEPIRILHVLGRLDRGGAETMVMSLYRNIDRSKIQFDFIKHTEEKCDYDDEIIGLGGKIFSIPRYEGKNHLKYKSIWKKFLKDNQQFKIVHGHMRSTASIYLKIARSFNRVTIAHSHNTSSGSGFSAIVKNIMQYPIRYIADYLFACSLPAGKWLFGEKKINKDNFFIVKNAIDTIKFSYDSELRLEKRRELNIQDKFVIGHVGRFHPQKNHEFLVEVFVEILKDDENAILLLVGDGELKKAIEEKIDTNGISDRVIFLGVREDVPEIFQAMDTFVFPSHYEGLGIVVIEAQASGLTCIVSDTIPEEVAISKLVHRISLNKSPKYWAENILENSRNYQRNKTDQLIKSHGYDIHDTAQMIQEWYLCTYNKVVGK